MAVYGDFVPGAFSAVCCVFSHFVGDKNTIAQPQNANELIKNLTVNNAASSQVTQKEVCVCVRRDQSVLGLEVEVISLIGTLPCSLPASP